MPDPSIELYANATVEPASGEQAHHILRYAPGHEPDLAHLLAHESGHLLRLYGVPEELRRIPYISAEHRERANAEMKTHLDRLERRAVPPALLNDLERVWQQGLIRQLYNTPTDMRIERWIRENYEGLVTAQRRSLKVNLAENQRALRPPVAAFTPGKLTRIANVLNAAYAIYLGWLLEDKRLDQPYRKTPYYKEGLNWQSRSGIPATGATRGTTHWSGTGRSISGSSSGSIGVWRRKLITKSGTDQAGAEWAGR